MRSIQALIVAFLCPTLVWAEAAQSGTHGFGDIVRDKGAPLSKEIYEVKREIHWRYAGEKVVFQDGAVLKPKKKMADEHTPLEVDLDLMGAETKRKKADEKRARRRRRVAGIGPKENLQDEEIEGMFKEFQSAGAKDKKKKKKK